MPLQSGSSRAVIGSNIREMTNAGRPHDQAVAAALRAAFGPKRADGGPVSGPLLGSTDGRADDIKTTVPDGSHVIPADVVSSLGEGNSVAGSAKLSKMFPRSVKAPKPRIAMRMPKMHGMSGTRGLSRMAEVVRPPKGFADGGDVDVRLSDGEFTVHPEDVARVGEGDIERGHKALNAWIVQVRNADIERRKRLPRPF